MSQVNQYYNNFCYSFAVGTILSAGCSAAIPSAIAAGVVVGALSVAALWVNNVSEPYFRKFLTGSEKDELSVKQSLLKRQIIIIGMALVSCFNPICRINLLFTALTDLAGSLVYDRYFKNEGADDKKTIFFPIPM